MEDKGAGMRLRMQEADEVALELEESLKRKDLIAASQSFKRLNQSCTQCHSKYRDQ